MYSSPTTSTALSIAYSTPPALIAVTLTVVVVCCICFSVVYFCRCYLVSVIETWAFHHPASATIIRLSPANNNNSSSPARGLDPLLLQTFPTFPYSSVKDIRMEETIRDMKYNQECAICLLEFEDGNTLRLLSYCRHMFHQDCIDLWLQSNRTCPVCRTDLETIKLHHHHDNNNINTAVEQEGRGGGEVCIDVKEEGGDEETGEQRFSRSHSTGHSIVMVRGGDGLLGRDNNDNDDDGNGSGDGIGGGGSKDKYMLRLQDHEKFRVVRGRHNFTKSCATYKEMMMMMMVAGPVVPCSSSSSCGSVQNFPGCSSRIGVENV